MKIVLLIVGLLVLVVAVMLLIGAALPPQHRTSREITLGRSPREVFAVASDFAHAALWRRNLRSVEMLAPVDRHARFRECARGGCVNYEVVEMVPDRKLVTRILDRDLGYFGSWTYEFLPNEAGTRVRITEDGEVPNVLFRFMSRFVFGQTKTLDDYLKSLGANFGETVTPR